MAASFLFCLLLLIGLVLTGVAAITLALAPSLAMCTVRNWVGHIAYASSFGGLLLKTYRLSKIANTKSLNIVHLPDSSLLAFYAAFVGIPMVSLPHLSQRVTFAMIACLCECMYSYAWRSGQRWIHS